MNRQNVDGVNGEMRDGPVLFLPFVCITVAGLRVCSRDSAGAKLSRATDELLCLCVGRDTRTYTQKEARSRAYTN